MTLKKNADFWLALILLAFCAYSGWLTLDLSTLGTGTKAGPSLIPWLMIVGIALAAVALLVRSLVQHRAAVDDAAKTYSFPLLAKLGLFLVLMLAYTFFYVRAGYLLSTIVFCIVAMLSLGERKFVHVAVIPIGLVITVYLVFTQIIKVYLP